MQSDKARQGVIDIVAAWARAQGLSVMIGIFQNPLRRHQIGRPEAFRKPAVDGLEAGDRIGPLALLTQEAGEARRRAQFPGQCLLAARH